MPGASSKTAQRVRVASLAVGVAALVVSLTGCTAKTETPSREQLYVARDTVEIRARLDPKSDVVAKLPLGVRLDVVGRRRSAVKVVTTDGVEGWTREAELVSGDVRRRMEALRQATADDPSQGEVRAYDLLNVHLEPYRWSPAVYQLQRNEGADLLRHELVERRDSRSEESGGRLEDWYLVRVPGGPAGWILAGRVYSGIPEEVAQYAEGRRITSFVALDEVLDPSLSASKTTWMWTQSDRPNQPHDFDRFRVFRWSPRRGAYQTIRLARGLTGYFPVRTYQRVESEYGSGPGFSFQVEDKGRLVEQTYVLVGQRVYLVSELPAKPLTDVLGLESQPEDAAPARIDPFSRLRSWWTRSSS